MRIKHDGFLVRQREPPGCTVRSVLYASIERRFDNVGKNELLFGYVDHLFLTSTGYCIKKYALAIGEENTLSQRVFRCIMVARCFDSGSNYFEADAMLYKSSHHTCLQ